MALVVCAVFGKTRRGKKREGQGKGKGREGTKKLSGIILIV
jgi:hypothetical protein